MNAEFIDMLRQKCSALKGDPRHTTFVMLNEIRDDVLEVFPDTIITTVPLSVQVADLMKSTWQLIGSRLVNGIECAEFMLLAPCIMRVAVLGTDFCVDGEYIMYRSYQFEAQEELPDNEEHPEPTVLIRQGIQV